MTAMTELLGIADIMERYGLQRATAASYMKKLPTLKVGRRLFVRAADLEAWEADRIHYPEIRLTMSPRAFGTIPRRGKA